MIKWSPSPRVETIRFRAQPSLDLLTEGAQRVDHRPPIAAGRHGLRSFVPQEARQGKAIDIYNTPLRQPGQPVAPNDDTYATAAERAKAANPLFVQVADHYGWLKAGDNAQYFAGLTYLDLNQTASAEKELQKAAGSSDKGLAALAKMALAGLYRQTGRDSQAVDLYNQVIKNPTLTVPAASPQLQMAQMYEATNPAEAKKIYAQIKDQNKDTAAGQIAAQKLAGK